MGDSKFPGEKGGAKKFAAPVKSTKAKPFVPLAVAPAPVAPIAKSPIAPVAAKPAVPARKPSPVAKPAPVTNVAEAPATIASATLDIKAAPAAYKTPVAAPVAVVPEPAPLPVAAPTVEPVVLASAAPEITAPPETDPVATPASAAAQSRGTIEMATTFDAPTTPAAATEKVKAMFGGLNDRAKTAMEKSTKMGEEISELTKGNVEALVASGKVAAKGAESMAQDAAEYSKKSFETLTSMFKSMAAAKSPTELFQLQSEFAKSSFDSAVAEASKVSEAWVKLAGEVVQPISNRYAVASEKLKAAAL